MRWILRKGDMHENATAVSVGATVFEADEVVL